MKVKLTTNLGTKDYPWCSVEQEKFTEGKTCTVSDLHGSALVKNGHAIAIEEPKPVKKSEPEPVASEAEAEAEPPKQDNFSKAREKNTK